MHNLCDIDGNNATSIDFKEFTGNIIPNSWYKKITTSSGKPDLGSIAILAEIVYWYRPGKDGNSKFTGNVWQTSYDHFEKKFGYNREAIRRIFVKLEHLKLISREFRTIEYRGHKYNNILFLHLNKKILFGEEKQCKKISPSIDKISTPSPHNSGEYIDNKNKLEKIYRSSKSNFILENLNFPPIQQQLQVGSEDIDKIIKPQMKYFSGKKLLEFHPLSTHDAELLSTKSGREFNLHFINQLLIKLASKYPDYKFLKREAFLNYLAKALSNEMHQACNVNNSDFRMSNCPLDKDLYDKTKEIDKYLSKIENSFDISEESILKKKLAGVFEPTKSYDFLKAYKLSYKEGDLLKIKLNNHIELTDFDKEILLNQVKTIYDYGLNDKVQNLEIEMPKKLEPSMFFDRNEEILECSDLPKNIWGKVRECLINQFGQGVDKSWFSKLEPEIDENERCISLSAPTIFMKDWIQINYERAIDIITQRLGFKLLGLKC